MEEIPRLISINNLIRQNSRKCFIVRWNDEKYIVHARDQRKLRLRHEKYDSIIMSGEISISYFLDKWRELSGMNHSRVASTFDSCKSCNFTPAAGLIPTRSKSVIPYSYRATFMKKLLISLIEPIFPSTNLHPRRNPFNFRSKKSIIKTK